MEEFQVLLNFLSSLRKQKELEIWSYQGASVSKDKTAEQVRVEVAVMIAQRNIAGMIETLPDVVDTLEIQIQKQKEQQEKFIKSQER